MELKKGQTIDVTAMFESANVTTYPITNIERNAKVDCYDLKTLSGWFVTNDGIVCKQCAGWSLSALLSRGIEALVPDPKEAEDDEIVVELDDGFTYAITTKSDYVKIQRDGEIIVVKATDIQPGDKILALTNPAEVNNGNS